MVLTRLRAGRAAARRSAVSADLPGVAALLSPLFRDGTISGTAAAAEDLAAAAWAGALFVADAFGAVAGVLSPNT